VEIDDVLAVLQQNVDLAKKTIGQAIKNFSSARTCGCSSALKTAIITDKSKIPKKVRRDLRPIIGKYL
jgi:5'-methylthioadenosine phosphorylase